MIIKTIDFSKLTCDCWMVQINGLSECKRCDFINTNECSGKNIREVLLKHGRLPELIVKNC